MFTSLLCCSKPDNPPVYANPTKTLPSPEAPDALDNTTPLVVQADTNTTPQEEHPTTGNVCTMPDRSREQSEGVSIQFSFHITHTPKKRPNMFA